MKLREFSIRFHQPKSVHFAGYWLRGTIHVVLNDSLKTKGISVHMIGKARIHWETYTHAKIYNNDKDYLAEEVYFDVRFWVYGSGEQTTLAAGEYNFPFQYKLHENLPSSFEGKYGHIRYTATAKIERPRMFDHVIKEPFTVLGCLDLNKENATWKIPHILAEEKRMGCCCFISESVEATITLNKRCFVPGETIYMNGAIYNRTKSTIAKSKCSLIQYIQFGAPGDDFSSSGKVHTKELAAYEVKVKGRKIRRGETEVWPNVSLIIPSLPPSRLDGCGIIYITYVFQVCVNAGFSSLKIKTPVIIGTVPLRETLQAYNLNPRSPNITVHTVQPGATPTAPSTVLAMDEADPLGAVMVSKDSRQTLEAYNPSPLPHSTAGSSSRDTPAAMDTEADLPPSYDSCCMLNLYCRLRRERPNTFNELVVPPSYAECVTGRFNMREENDGTEHVQGSRTWAPFYTTYQFPNTVPQTEPTTSADATY